MNDRPVKKFVGTGRMGLTEVSASENPTPAPAFNTGATYPMQATSMSTVVSDDEFLNLHKKKKALEKATKENREAVIKEQARQEKMAILAALSRATTVELPENVTVDLEFPIHTFPQGAQRWITDMGSAFKVHASVPGTMLRGATSIICQGKYKIQRHSNHIEQGVLYILSPALSGKLKTPIMEACIKPIAAIEKELQELAAQQEQEHGLKRRLIKKRIQQLERKAAKSGNLDTAMLEIKSLEKDLPPDFVLPVFTLSKFTPEGLEQEAMRQNGRIAIVGSELGSFKNIQSNKDDFLLVGYVGEDYIFMKSGSPVVIRNSTVSIMLATQDMTAIKLLNDSELQAEGLIGRFILLVAPDITSLYPGGALTSEVPESSAKWLDKIIRAIHAIPRPDDGYSVLRVEQSALSEWAGFAHYVKVQTESKETSTVLKTFYRKLAGTALRLALFLHILECVEKGIAAESVPVGLSAIQGGIQLAQFYEQHAKAALDVKRSESLRRAHKLVNDFKARKNLEINVRKLYRKKKWSRDETMAALEILSAYGYVALHQCENSVTCLINPNIQKTG